MKLLMYIGALLLFILPAGAVAQKAKITNPGASASFGFCTSGDAACESANRVRNDLARPYVNGTEGVSAVFNLGSGTRDLTINLITSQRSAWLDFTENTYAGNPHPTWWSTAPSQNVKPFINVLKAYYAKELCVPAADGSCVNDYLTAMNTGNWKVGTTDYKLQWNPNSQATYINTAETTSAVNVRYVRTAGGAESFTITPVPNLSSGRIIAGLEATASRKTTAAGQYKMPFTMTVTIVP